MHDYTESSLDLRDVTHPDIAQDGVQSAYLVKGCAGFHPRSRRSGATGTLSVLFRGQKHSQDLGVDGRVSAIYRKLLRHNVCALGLLEKENAQLIVHTLHPYRQASLRATETVMNGTNLDTDRSYREQTNLDQPANPKTQG